jgi:hypothetical protein
MKNRRIVLPCTILVVVCVLVLWENGTISTFQNGLAFMMQDSAYHINYSNVDSVAEAEIDLYNLESNAWKIIYDDGECKIEIKLLRQQENGAYNIFFRTHGKYKRSGGTLISSVKQIRNENGTYSYECVGIMQVIVDDKAYEGRNSALSGLNYKDGDEFGFYLFPLDCYENGQFLLDNQIKNQNGKVKIQLSHLNKTTWIR